MRRILTLVLSVVALYASAVERQSFTAVLTAGGQLAETLGNQANQIESLVVEGPLDEADFKTMWSACWNGVLTDIDLSQAKITGNSIPNHAFYHPREQEYELPDHALSIRFLPITSIILPDEVESIGDFAFAYTKITSVKFPASLKTLGKGVFKHCRFLEADIELPEQLTNIPPDLFYGCKKIGKVFCHDKIESIGMQAFYESGLTEINIPEGVTEIVWNAFSRTKLSSITIPESCIKMGPGILAECDALTSVTVKSRCYIPEYFALYSTNLAECTLAEGIEVIGQSAFGLTALKTITLPASLKKIEDDAFFLTDALESIYSLATIPFPQGEVNAFDCDKSIPVYIPQGSLEAYKSMTGWWSYFTNLIEVDMAGVDDAVAAPAAGVSVQGGTIVIAGNGEDYAVFSADGRSIAAGRASGSVSVDAAPGLYIVRTGAKTVKVRL